MTERPLVSVLLPCFDAERFVGAALDSLLGQTYREFEVLAIDDASTDGTLAVLEAHAARDKRIRVLRNERNLGLIATLNLGVAKARSELIARMDADDLAAPTRIERQVEALERHPEIGVLGTAIEIVGRGRGRSLGPRPLRCATPAGARFAALMVTPVVHATILARAPVMRAHPYSSTPESLHAEDYELFARMLENGVGFANLDEVLLAVRANPDGVSLRHEPTQVENFVACAALHLRRSLGVGPDPGAHLVMVNRIDETVTGHDLEAGLALLDRLERGFLDSEPGAAAEIRRCADMQRLDVLAQAALRAPADVRLSALRLALRYRRRLLSPATRGYLSSKLSHHHRRSAGRNTVATLAPQGSR